MRGRENEKERYPTRKTGAKKNASRGKKPMGRSHHAHRSDSGGDLFAGQKEEKRSQIGFDSS